MSCRYRTEREAGSDWSVIDNKRRFAVATGLSLDEAEETARSMNEREDEENSVVRR